MLHASLSAKGKCALWCWGAAIAILQLCFKSTMFLRDYDACFSPFGLCFRIPGGCTACVDRRSQQATYTPLFSPCPSLDRNSLISSGPQQFDKLLPILSPVPVGFLIPIGFDKAECVVPACQYSVGACMHCMPAQFDASRGLEQRREGAQFGTLPQHQAARQCCRSRGGRRKGQRALRLRRARLVPAAAPAAASGPARQAGAARPSQLRRSRCCRGKVWQGCPADVPIVIDLNPINSFQMAINSYRSSQ